MADYDVIVAGGGLAGTITAQSISHYSNQNLKILVVDRNSELFPGRNHWQVGYVEMHVPKKQSILCQIELKFNGPNQKLNMM